MARQGVVVEPYHRLKTEQVERIHQASLDILADPGILCFNRNAANIFGDNGAEVMSLEQVRSIMATSLKLYVRFVRRALRSGEIAPPYPFEGKDMVDVTLLHARERMAEIMSLPPHRIDKSTEDRVFQEVPGLLTRLR